jgi:transcriptional regulator with XRE-family HTH domain|nr:MAG TPA: hypothetical protein [Caudoviricetes sp.]
MKGLNMLKRFNNKKNISGTLLKKSRENKGMTKKRLSEILDTYGIYINPDELLRIEKNKVLVKDFELVAIAQILDIDLNQLKSNLED